MNDDGTKTPSLLLNEARWQLRPLREILNRTYEEPDWIINTLLLNYASCLCSGLPHAMKSLNWLCAALESVTTRKIWDQFDVRHVKNVLYIETEDHPSVVERRVRELAIGLGLDPKHPPEGFHLATPGPFNLVEAGHTWIRRAIDQSKADWVVLSTLQGLLAGRDWIKQDEMGPVNAILVEISRECPIVVITHSPWNRKIRRAVGTVAQAANYLSAMHFEKIVGDDGTLTHVWVDTKLGEAQEFKLELITESTLSASGSMRQDLRRIAYRHESKRIRVEQYVITHPLASAEEVAAICECSARYVYEIKQDSVAVMLANRHKI